MMDDTVKGKITIISPNPVTVDEAYQAFLAALAMKKYTVVDKGAVTMIRRRSDAMRESEAILDEYSDLSSDQMVTRIIPIKYISANDIHKALKGLFARSQSRLVPYGPTNSLIITDLASNVRRLIKIVQKLDQPGFETTVEVVPLKYAQAKEVADKILQIFDGNEKGRGNKSAASTAFSSSVDQQPDVSKVIPDDRSNSLIVTANRKGLERVLDLVAQLDQEVASDLSRSRIHVRHLKHADSEEVATLLSGILNNSKPSNSRTPASGEKDKTPARTIEAGGKAISSGLFQEDIRIGADPGTNSLVITATPSDFEALEPVIQSLDRRRPQVFVEALIMEVNMTKGLEVGSSLHGAGTAGDVGFVGSSRPAGSTLNPEGQTENNAFSSLFGAGGLGLGFLSQGVDLGNGISIPGVGGILKAVQNNSNFNVLSSPNILTTDNKQAEIVVGEKVQVPVNVPTPGNNALGTQLEPVEADLKLLVTPQINEGDEVTLEIEQQINEFLEVDLKNGIRTSKRTAKTTVVAQNGQTVVIGGLIKNKETQGVQKVPLLGDVPILGTLFKQKNTQTEKVNLMVFLTPTILRDSKDMSRISVKKNNQRKQFNKKHKIDENSGLYDYGFNETLNMAPVQVVDEKKQTPSQPREIKRFDYMNDTSSSQDAEPSNSTLRGRNTMQPASSSFATQTPLRNRAETAADQEPVTSQADASNPFANVRPN
jgi:general secretion pathway protein D